MQIDLHLGMTWVVARAAGFSNEQANIIAHASQYVDDATNEGHIKFNNGAAYQRIATAHKMLDYRNIQSLKNQQVWIPFHFLPGNSGLPAGSNPSGRFVHKLVCKPNSYVARDMVNECIAHQHKPYALHLLGITSHVFIDTWGHKGFAGIQHKVNKVDDIKDHNGQIDKHWTKRITDYFMGMLQDDIPSLGHGQALSNPDLPHQHSSYTNGMGEVVERNNPVDFLEAADELCKVYQIYLNQQPTGLNELLKAQIAKCFTDFNMDAGQQRLALWIEAIANDEFSLGPYQLSYIAKGAGSWKHEALGTTLIDKDEDEYTFTQAFLTSNWKLFHDAAKQHRLNIVDIILPRYGICVA
ncbi:MULTISPECIES: DUF6765 family protein [Pseudoalteromonas]|uniref:Uncharacterized protein n=1 Tax=Pseudoalteromonas amylolytica TaxID=1859457 RepID=A0A1S1MWE9_9GAMM|nr:MULTISPECIES: DUF6765 family protein [Pseudoalteromonas]OHU86179.1 hypothetical protein BFC16_15855 [Pseudoalteromonas sp. JW3]OHU89714.1 hypothetical protein BET10_16460 [Pseudoalteromonas amylolytica]